MVESDGSIYWAEEEDEYDEDLHMLDDVSNNRDSYGLSQQGGDGGNSSSSSLPLGLRLNPTPSFINMVEMTVSKRKSKTKTTDVPCERLKAGNFAAASIKIGNWQRISRHEGDLTAKLYYAKRKLVWEVLEGALKCKIEMQWSDISGIRAVMLQNQPGTLEIELNQPPLYYREVTPQPRKHTLWRQSSDFTGGQAPVWRRHIVSFKPGILDKHYEKLLQCNKIFLDMSRKPFPSHESPYFDPTTLGNSGISLSFDRPYGSSYYHPYPPYPTAPSTQPTSLTLPPSYLSLPVIYENQPQSALWGEGPSYRNQIYDQNPQYQQEYNDVENHLLGDQSHVPSFHHSDVELPMGSFLEPTDVIHPNSNYSSTGYQYPYAADDQMTQYAGNNAPVTDDGFYSHQQLNWNMPPAGQHYSDNNNVIINNQGTSSLTPYSYPGYDPTTGGFF